MYLSPVDLHDNGIGLCQTLFKITNGISQINRFKRIADPGNIIQATAYIRITVFQVSGYAIDILENFRNRGTRYCKTFKVPEACSTLSSVRLTLFRIPRIFPLASSLKISCKATNTVIQRDHYRLGFLLQGFQLFVQLFHDTQFQSGLKVSRSGHKVVASPGMRLMAFEPIKSALRMSSNGIGRYSAIFPR